MFGLWDCRTHAGGMMYDPDATRFFESASERTIRAGANFRQAVEIMGYVVRLKTSPTRHETAHERRPEGIQSGTPLEPCGSSCAKKGVSLRGGCARRRQVASTRWRSGHGPNLGATSADRLCRRKMGWRGSTPVVCGQTNPWPASADSLTAKSVQTVVHSWSEKKRTRKGRGSLSSP